MEAGLAAFVPAAPVTAAAAEGFGFRLASSFCFISSFDKMGTRSAGTGVFS